MTTKKLIKKLRTCGDLEDINLINEAANRLEQAMDDIETLAKAWNAICSVCGAKCKMAGNTYQDGPDYCERFKWRSE